MRGNNFEAVKAADLSPYVYAPFLPLTVSRARYTRYYIIVTLEANSMFPAKEIWRKLSKKVRRRMNRYNRKLSRQQKSEVKNGF